VPLTLWTRVSENGALSALISLAQDGLLSANVEPRSFAREICSETGLSEARQRLLERASGGPHDTFLNKVLARPVARPLTQALLPLGVPPFVLDMAALVVGLVGAVLLAATSLGPAPAMMLSGAFLIIASTVFDCAAFELRSFAVRPGAPRGPFQALPHGIVTAAAVGAFGYGAQQLGVPDAAIQGLFAAGGAVIGTLLLALAAWLGGGKKSDDPATLGIQLLERRVVNREIGWLLLVIAAAHFIVKAVRPTTPDEAPHMEVLTNGVVCLAALAQAYWVALVAFLALQPRKN
jgi:hypothetical protein